MAFSQVGMPKGSKGCILTIIIHPVKAEGRTQEVMCSRFCCCCGGCGICIAKMGFLGSSVLKNLPANAGDVGDAGSILGFDPSILGSGQPPGRGNGNPLQCFCLKNPMDRGA